MIIKVEVIYEAMVLKARKRDPRAAFFTATVVADIPEIDPQDAPVAFTHADASSDVPAVARTYDGRLWAREGDVEDVLANPSDTFGGPHGAGKGHHEVSATTAEADPGVRHTYRSDLDDVTEAVRRDLADWIVIDGAGWKSFPEPVVRFEYVGERLGAKLSFRGSVDRHTFRLDQAEAAAAALRNVDPASVAAAVADLGLVIHEADAFRLDTVTPPLAEAADTVFRHMRDRIAHADARYFASYARIRDARDPLALAMDVRDARGRAADVGKVVAAAERMSDVLADAVSLHGTGPNAYPDWLVERVDDALARRAFLPTREDVMGGFVP